MLDREWGGSRKPSYCRNPGEKGWWFRAGGVAESVRGPIPGIFQRLWMRGLRESFSVLELLVA